MKKIFLGILNVLSWFLGLIFLIFSIALFATSEYVFAILFFIAALFTTPYSRLLFIKLHAAMNRAKDNPTFKSISKINAKYIIIPLSVVGIVILASNHSDKVLKDYLSNKSKILQDIQQQYDRNEPELALKTMEPFIAAVKNDHELSQLHEKITNKIQEKNLISEIKSVSENDYEKLEKLYSKLIKIQPSNKEYSEKHAYYQKYKNSLITERSDKWYSLVDDIKENECKNEKYRYEEAYAVLTERYHITTRENIYVMRQAEAAGATEIAESAREQNAQATKEFGAQIRPYLENLAYCVNNNLKKLGYIVIKS